MIALLVLTDGRGDYLDRTLASADKHLKGNIGERILVNDAFQDEPYLERLQGKYDPKYNILTHARKLGFSGAIQAGWDAVGLYNSRSKSQDKITHVFHLENDFTFNEDVDLDEMALVLDSEPKLAQLALLRQAWNDQEKATGGVIHANPDAYEQTFLYIKHSVCFTTNPSLYRAELTARGWPQVPFSEGNFSIGLRADGYHFGYWQDEKFSPPKVHHIGRQRVGTGY